MNGEIARHLEFRVTGFLGALGPESNRRVFSHVKKIRTLQMFVALGVARRDGGGVHDGIYLGRGRIGGIVNYCSFDTAKGPADVTEHQMAHREMHARMSWINLIGGFHEYAFYYRLDADRVRFVATKLN